MQDFSLRQFLLTNLVGNGNGSERLRWKVNLDAIDDSIQNLKDFPSYDSVYPSPTLFIGGAESNYIT